MLIKVNCYFFLFSLCYSVTILKMKVCLSYHKQTIGKGLMVYRHSSIISFFKLVEIPKRMIFYNNMLQVSYDLGLKNVLDFYFYFSTFFEKICCEIWKFGTLIFGLFFFSCKYTVQLALQVGEMKDRCNRGDRERHAESPVARSHNKASTFCFMLLTLRI